jgi:hypothetical protein
MLEHVRDRFHVWMGVGDVLGDVPALNRAVGQRRRAFNKPALFDAVAPT